MKKRKVLCIALSFVLLFSLTACAGNYAVGTTGSESSQTEASEAAAPSETGSTDEAQTTITFAINVGNCKEQNPEYYYSVQRFMEANPDVKIEMIENATEEHNSLMQLYASTNELPDIFWLYEGDAGAFQKNGYLLALNDFFEANPDISAAIADPLEYAYSDENGTIYGIPCSTFITGMWYNKAVFDACGIPYPTDDTTYEDLLAMVEPIRDNGYVCIAEGALTNYSIWCWLGSFNRYGYADKIDAVMSGELSFAEFRPLLEKLAELGANGAFPDNYATIDYFEAKDLFKAGNVAMFNAGVWDAATVTESLGDNIGFWWGPTFSDSDYSQATVNQFANAPFVVSSAVANDPAKKEAVYRFLKYFYGKEGASIMNEYSTVSTANYADLDSTNETAGFMEIIAALGNGNESASFAQPVSSLDSSVAEVIYDSVQSLITGSMSVDDAIADIDAAISRLD